MQLKFLLLGSVIQFILYILIGFFTKNQKIKSRILFVCCTVYLVTGIIMSLCLFLSGDELDFTGTGTSNPILLISILGIYRNKRT